MITNESRLKTVAAVKGRVSFSPEMMEEVCDVHTRVLCCSEYRILYELTKNFV